MSAERPEVPDPSVAIDASNAVTASRDSSLVAVDTGPSQADPDVDQEFDLDSPEYYLNRELTWLEFNWRVLHEAEDERTPLLERVKFLAIVNSNLDEFFMKRIGGLKQQVGAGMHDVTVDGRTPREQIAECLALVARIERRCADVLEDFKKLLWKAGIVVARVSDLDEKEQEATRQWYLENVYPLVTPQAMDPAHPFPFVSNLSINLLVSLHHPKDAAPLMARVKVPVGLGIPRMVRVGDDDVFVMLEDIMAENLDLLFPGMEITACELFRVIRNANTERNEEHADDLLAMIQSEVRDR